MKRGLLMLLKRRTKDSDTPMGNEDVYCTYHEWKGYATYYFHDLKLIILDMIAKGKYHLPQHASNLRIEN